MRYQTVKKIFVLSFAGVLIMAAPLHLYASETKNVMESETEKENNTEDLVLKWKDKEYVIKNEAVPVLNVEVEETGTDSLTNTWNLVLTEENGAVHTFEDVAADQWTDLELICEYEWLYLRYQDESGSSRETAETAEEKKYEEPITMWVTTDVNVREEASSDSAVVCVSTLGSKLEASGIVSGWINVKGDDYEGYIYHRYLTADEEAAEKAVQAENYARAAAEAAAAQAWAEAAAAQSEENYGKTVVSRQAYDDCDGSGHGYYEIVYSDGSIAYEDY